MNNTLPGLTNAGLAVMARIVTLPEGQGFAASGTEVATCRKLLDDGYLVGGSRVYHPSVHGRTWVAMVLAVEVLTSRYATALRAHDTTPPADAMARAAALGALDGCRSNTISGLLELFPGMSESYAMNVASMAAIKGTSVLATLIDFGGLKR